MKVIPYFHSILPSRDGISTPITCTITCEYTTVITIINSYHREPEIKWCRQEMETLCALLAICAWNSPVTGDLPAQRLVTLSFGVFFDLRLNKLWVNNREAGNLRRHRAHYGVTVMNSQGFAHSICKYIFCNGNVLTHWGRVTHICVG